MQEVEHRRMFHVLDDETLDRMNALYTAVLEDVELYAEQLRRWHATDLTLGERNTVEQLGKQVQMLRAGANELLAIEQRIRFNLS